MKLKGEGTIKERFRFDIEISLGLIGGVVSGVALGGLSNPEIIMTGLVLLAVTCGSMWWWKTGRSKDTTVVILLSNFMAGMVPIIPYMILQPGTALKLSLFLTLLSLFVLGVFDGWRKGINPTEAGIKTVILGGFTLGVGMLAGRLFGFR